MKQMHYYIVCAIVAVCCLASCSDDTFERPLPSSVEERGAVRKVEATIADFVTDNELDTRTSVVAVDNELQFVWTERDTIGIFPNVGFQVAFPMAEGAGTKSAVFNGGGWGLKSTATYAAYAPLVGEFYLDRTRIPLSLSGQKQSGNGNRDHLSAYDYMAAVNAAVDENGSVAFNFNHLVSILHLYFQLPKAGTYKTLLLETSGSFVTEATLDLTDGSVAPQKTSAIQTLELDDVAIGENELLEVYVAILPVDMTDKTLTAKIYDDEGICYTATLPDKEYVAGTFYNIGRTAEKDVLNTGLPIVLINTSGNQPITQKTDWMKNASITILNTDGSVDCNDEALQIRGRGNSTWGYPKKPYALKLSSKTQVLGMPKHKRWVLLANWMDRTLMRNDIAFQISKLTGLAWTPRGQFVEVVLNGKHIGNYYLCEQIKVDKNRVNIAEMEETDIEGDALTGGYLMELDTYFDEVNKFKSTRNLPYMFKSPDEDVLQPAQLTYFQNYINEMEAKMYADDWLTNREYADYMDLASFVDWWLVHELMMNGEPNHPKSSYMHKDRLGKLVAGPVWDFDWATLVPGKASSYTIKNAIYYGRLFSDPDFVSLTKERWTSLKPRFETVPDYIRSVAGKIKASNEINTAMWPLSANATGSTNGDQNLSFDDAVERLITAYTTKLNWLDTTISKLNAGN